MVQPWLKVKFSKRKKIMIPDFDSFLKIFDKKGVSFFKSCEWKLVKFEVKVVKLPFCLEKINLLSFFAFEPYFDHDPIKNFKKGRHFYGYFFQNLKKNLSKNWPLIGCSRSNVTRAGSEWWNRALKICTLICHSIILQWLRVRKAELDFHNSEIF